MAQTRLMIAALGVAVAIGTPVAAEATQGLTWASASSPLTAWNDGHAQAQAYGITYIGNDAKAWNHAWYRDAASGGNKAYAETNFAYHEVDNLGEVRWGAQEGTRQTVRTNNYDWSNQYSSNDPASGRHYQADQVRIYFKACEDRRFGPDLCSREPWHTKNL